jgi:site-specific recombinase XerD
LWRDTEGKKDMTEEQSKILIEYIEHLKFTGKSIKNPKHALNIMFDYMNENNIEFENSKIKDAEDFQSYLATRTDDDPSTSSSKCWASNKLKYTSITVSGIIARIKTFYEYLKDKRMIYANPFDQIKRIKTGKSLPKNILNEEDMNRLLNALKNFNAGKTLKQRKKLYKMHVISELMYSTGARINEVISLTKDDADFERSVIRLYDRKTKQSRFGFLNEYANKILKIYTEQMRDYVLFGSNNADMRLLFGSRYNLRQMVNDEVNGISRRLKLGHFASHNFRHAVGYHLLKNGCDIRYIQEILGHKKISSTQVYTKVDRKDLKNVIDKFHPRTFRSNSGVN